MADRTINLRPHHLRRETRDGEITLIFSGHRGDAESGTPITVRIAMPRWWVGVVADELREFMAGELESCRRLMGRFGGG